VLGTATRNAADFHSVWLISVVGGLSAGALLAALGPPVRRPAGAPAGKRPTISEPIADPLIAEPLVLEEA
jgi:hypothetical protein